jgi:hypothetical protein
LFVKNNPTIIYCCCIGTGFAFFRKSNTMKKFLPAIFFLFLFASCKTSKDYLAHRNEDKTLYNIVKQLNKHADDELAVKALPEVYGQLQQTHLGNIDNARRSTELSRWDKIINEYNILQDMYNAVINSSAASNIIKAVSYRNEIENTRQAAAGDYYTAGMAYFNTDSWEDARKAYTLFKKADGWISNYNGSMLKIDSARQKGIVTVVINPVQDNGFFFTTGWNGNGMDLNSAAISQNLMADLGGKSAGRYAARFYTDWLAQRENVEADWLVDIALRDVQIPSPSVYNYTRNLSEKVEAGTDSSGKALYKTVYATLHIQRKSFNASAQMDLNITDPATRKNILFDSFSDSYRWQQEVASYSGDSRALGNRDWELVNNQYYQPGKEEVLGELYRGLYPQVKNRLGRAVDF